METWRNPWQCEYPNNPPPDSKVHEAYIGPHWGRQDPGGPHVGPMNLAIRAGVVQQTLDISQYNLAHIAHPWRRQYVINSDCEYTKDIHKPRPHWGLFPSVRQRKNTEPYQEYTMPCIACVNKYAALLQYQGFGLLRKTPCLIPMLINNFFSSMASDWLADVLPVNHKPHLIFC